MEEISRHDCAEKAYQPEIVNKAAPGNPAIADHPLRLLRAFDLRAD